MVNFPSIPPQLQDQLQPLFIDLNDVGPGVHRGERRNQNAALRGDVLKTPLESLASGIIFGTGGEQPLAPLGDLLLG